VGVARHLPRTICAVGTVVIWKTLVAIIASEACEAVAASSCVACAVGVTRGGGAAIRAVGPVVVDSADVAEDPRL